MTGVCRYCGSRLLPGAVCCSKCGRDVGGQTLNTAAPQPQVCGVCGKQLLNGAAFCSGCGAAAGSSSRAKTRLDKPGTLRIIAVVLAFVIGVEGVLFGLSYRKRGGIEMEKTGITGVSNKLENNDSDEDWSWEDEEDDTFSYVYLSENIPFRYTKEDIENAPKIRAEVSLEKTAVSLGDAQVDFGQWALENEKDEIIMKDLPTLSQGESEDDWHIKGYDFSLASGQDKFATDVRITIPREQGECCAKCLYFNEADNCWEDVYYEISEDNSSYIIYTDHFSKYSKMYMFDTKKFELTENNLGKLALDSGIFYEKTVKVKKSNRMLWKVDIDIPRMWNMYQKATADDKTLELFAKYLSDPKGFILKQESIDKVNEWLGNFGLGGDILEVLINPPDYNEFLNPNPDLSSISAMSWWLTWYKIGQEAKNGSTSCRDFLTQRLPKAIKNNAGEIGFGVAGIASSVIFSGPVGFAASVLLFLGGYSYNSIKNLKSYYLTDKENLTLEQLYNYYCTRGVNGRGMRGAFFDEKKCKDYREIYIDMPETDEEVINKLKKIQRHYEDARMKTFFESSDDQSKLVFDNQWVDVITVLYESYWNDPEALTDALDKLYYNFAYGFWRLEEKYVREYLRNLIMCNLDEWTYEEYNALIERYTDMILNAKGYDKQQLTLQMVELMKASSTEMLEAIQKKVQREYCLKIQKDFKESILPALNVKLKFHVRDGSLKEGQKFSASKYCVDWKKIKANKGFEGQYDSEELITPMRFGGDPFPEFLPLLKSDTIDITAPSTNKNQNYYPYKDNFLPRAFKNTDVVYSCTMYHYLMMGAPKEMIFRDVNDKDSEPFSVKFEVPKYKKGDKVIDVWIDIPGTPKDNVLDATLRVYQDDIIDFNQNWFDDGVIRGSLDNPMPLNVRVTGNWDFKYGEDFLTATGDVEVSFPDLELSYKYNEFENPPEYNYCVITREAFTVKGTIETATKKGNKIYIKGALLDVPSEISGSETVTLYHEGKKSSISTEKSKIYDIQLNKREWGNPLSQFIITCDADTKKVCHISLEINAKKSEIWEYLNLNNGTHKEPEKHVSDYRSQVLVLEDEEGTSNNDYFDSSTASITWY